MFNALLLGGAFVLQMLALSVAPACVEAASSSEEASVPTRTAPLFLHVSALPQSSAHEVDMIS
jgi:hypothetical protein